MAYANWDFYNRTWHGSIAVDVGDMITPGLVSAAVTSSADVLKMFPDSFKVLRIRDNRRGSLQMQHWRIEGE